MKISNIKMNRNRNDLVLRKIHHKIAMRNPVCLANKNVLVPSRFLQLTSLLTTHIASYNSHRFLQLSSLLTTQCKLTSFLTSHIASCNPTSLLGASHQLLQCKTVCVLHLTSLLATSHRFLQLIFLQPHIASYNAHRFVEPSMSQACSDWKLIVWSDPMLTTESEHDSTCKGLKAKWPPNDWQLIPRMSRSP